jgi:hypothetical protein
MAGQRTLEMVGEGVLGAVAGSLAGLADSLERGDRRGASVAAAGSPKVDPHTERAREDTTAFLVVRATFLLRVVLAGLANASAA